MAGQGHRSVGVSIPGSKVGPRLALVQAPCGSQQRLAACSCHVEPWVVVCVCVGVTQGWSHLGPACCSAVVVAGALTGTWGQVAVCEHTRALLQDRSELHRWQLH